MFLTFALFSNAIWKLGWWAIKSRLLKMLISSFSFFKNSFLRRSLLDHSVLPPDCSHWTLIHFWHKESQRQLSSFKFWQFGGRTGEGCSLPAARLQLGSGCAWAVMAFTQLWASLHPAGKQDLLVKIRGCCTGRKGVVGKRELERGICAAAAAGGERGVWCVGLV